MKKLILVVLLVLIASFSTAAFAVETTDPLGAAAAALKTKAADEAVKGVSGEIIIGTIKKIDKKAKTITIKDQIITVTDDQLTQVKKGQKVKVNLATGTMNAESITPVGKKEVKEEAKKQAKKAKEEAIQKATDETVKAISNQ